MEICRFLHSWLCRFLHGRKITQFFSICAKLENVGLCGSMLFYVGLMVKMVENVN